MVKFDFGKYKHPESQKVVVQEVKKIAPEVTIQEVKKKKIVADRTKGKAQLAKQINKLLIDDTKRPKNQQQILIEKYRSTLNDLKHIIYTPNTEIDKELDELQKTQEYLVENGLKVLNAYENCKKLLHYNLTIRDITKEDLDLLDRSIERSKYRIEDI